MSSNNDFVSSIKEIPYNIHSVYNKLQDLRNLESIRAKFEDATFMENLKASIGEDKALQVQAQLNNLQFTQDSLSLASPMGNVNLVIVEREEPKCVKFEAQGAPISAWMWIQLLPLNDNACKLRLTIRAELSFFIRKMVESKLAAGVEQMADIIARIPYGE